MKERLLAWEEHRASRQIVDALGKAVVQSVPASATRLGARFPNGIELLAADMGDRLMSTNHPLRIALYFRVTERVEQPCQVRIIFSEDGRKMRIRGAGQHLPVGGALPFQYFPQDEVVEDVFHIAWRGDQGYMDGFLALRCGGKKRIRALPGPNVNEHGWVELGDITVSKRKQR
jgi:hypothetical protein